MLRYFPYKIIKKKKEQSQYSYTCTVAVLLVYLTNYKKKIIQIMKKKNIRCYLILYIRFRPNNSSYNSR